VRAALCDAAFDSGPLAAFPMIEPNGRRRFRFSACAGA
jgi:hypothetical protein